MGVIRIDRVRLNKDFLAGLVFVGIGLFGFWLARNLESGTASDMATGYFPRMMCGLLVALGAVLAGVALVTGGEKPDGWHWRQLILVSLSAIGFALLLKPLGFVLTIFATVLLATLAGGGLRVVPLLMLSTALVVFNVGLFVLALRMPIPLWPSLF